jgi:fermentation-respiration switch protein FrsA (DUF1100 family)
MAEPGKSAETPTPPPAATRAGIGGKLAKTVFLGIVILAALYASACVSFQLFGRKMLYHPNADVVAPERAGVSAVRLRTADGETLVAWWAPPAQGAPVFLFFDGNGGRPEIGEGRWKRITETGAGFLAVYYRGYSGSTGRPTEKGLHQDARAGYDWLIAQGFTPQDIVIHGFSLGSSVAAKLASERPARALILEAPFTAAVDVAKRKAPWAPLQLIMSDQYRSRDWIGEVRMPVLVAHGDRDHVIPFAHGQRLYALANEPKRFVQMAGSDHATLVRDGLYDHVWAFLADDVTPSFHPSCTRVSTRRPSPAAPKDARTSQAACLRASAPL